jgi:diaminopimelate epimerase
MIEIPFAKLHGAENDFLLSWGNDISDVNLPDIARRICARTTGIGADGWMLVWKSEAGLRTRLFNSDGSEPEISGNGTRCAAAFGLLEGAVAGPDIQIITAAGPKHLHLVAQSGLRYVFEMDMGLPQTEELRASMHLGGRTWETTILSVGNPQCAIFVDVFPEDWRVIGAEAEGHSRFSQRSNVSFVRVVDSHTIEAVFYERGAGETRSSGTGSTGAAAAAILRGAVKSPVEIRTPAGSLHLRWENTIYLQGPAEMIGKGVFFFEH